MSGGSWPRPRSGAQRFSTLSRAASAAERACGAAASELESEELLVVPDGEWHSAPGLSGDDGGCSDSVDPAAEGLRVCAMLGSWTVAPVTIGGTL